MENKTKPGEIKAERLMKAIELTERAQFYLREIQAEILLRPSEHASLLLQAL